MFKSLFFAAAPLLVQAQHNQQIPLHEQIPDLVTPLTVRISHGWERLN